MIEETMNGQSQPSIPTPPQKTVESEIENKLNGLVLQVFNNESGQQLLDLWDDIYVRQLSWKPGVPEGFAQYRAGQNHIVLATRAVLNQAKKGGVE